jgi:hypothetical protein
MARTAQAGSTGNNVVNNAGRLVRPKGKPRGRPFEKGHTFGFKKTDKETGLVDPRINLEGRPKGHTAKEMLRRELNLLISVGGVPNKDGIVKGHVVARTVVNKAMMGDLKATQIVYQYDQDRPNPIGAGELVPGTNVYVTANAQANAQVEQPKESGRPSLADRMRAIYNLGPRPVRGAAAASVAVAVSGES